MNKNLVIGLGLVGALALCSSAIWWLQQEQDQPEQVSELVKTEKPIQLEQSVSQPVTKPIPVTDMRHLSSQDIVTTQVESSPQNQVKQPADNTPEQVVIYDSELAKQPSYTLKQYDDQGNLVGELQVIDETIQSDGQIAVTLALDNGNTAKQINAVPNAEQRGYAINLTTWEYASIGFEELMLMFEKGDKLAGLQIGYLMLTQDKLDEAVPFLVEASKISGFSRPLDMIANEYFKRGQLINTAVWGRLAAAYSGFDDWGSRITLMVDDMQQVEQQATKLRQRYQLK